MKIETALVTNLQEAINGKNWTKVCSIYKSLPDKSQAKKWIMRLIEQAAPSTVLNMWIKPEFVDLQVLKGLITTHCQSKIIPEMVHTCLTYLRPQQLHFDLVEVDFWKGLLLRQGSFHFHLSWTPWTLDVLSLLLDSGCSRPAQRVWLPNAYCFSDPEHVNYSLEAIHMWKHYIANPDSLSQCCRIVIRNSMKTVQSSAFDQFMLPKPLVKYLRMEKLQP